MINKLTISLALIVVFVLAAIAFIVLSPAFASIGTTALSSDVQTNNPSIYRPFTFFAATTTTATSTTNGGEYLKIAGAEKVELYFSRGGATGPNTGQTQFLVQVTPDGTNWYDYGKLLIATSTTQGAQSSVFISGTSSAAVALDLRTDTLLGLRVIARETTDGDHTAVGFVQY